MATLKEFKDSYYELSGIASDVSRKLGFAGIAVIWVFKTDLTEKAYTLAPELYCAGVFIVLSLALDLLQYVFGSFIWGVFWRSKEKSGATDSQQITAPPCYNWPALVLFWGKLLLMVIAYYYLLKFLLGHVSATT